MTVSLLHDGTISRVRITATGLGVANAARVERSTDQVTWTTVRGGLAAPVVAGEVDLDDYEFAADVQNFYRVRGFSDPITLVGPGATVSDGNATGTATLSPAFPPGIAVGDLLVLFATIRNSAGTVNTPAGWTPMLTLGRLSVIGRVYDGVFTAPTVTFSGGIANATIIARISAWRGAGLTPVDTATLINASGQNIAHPALTVTKDRCLILAGCWKIDAWTTVDTLAGFTEIQDSPVIDGDDASQALDYVVQTAKFNIAAGQFVVTGGSPNVSRSFLMSLETGFLNTQTADITPILGSVWLKSLSNPALNRPVKVRDWSPVRRRNRSGSFDILGAKLPVALSEPRGGKQYVLRLRAADPAEAAAIDMILDAGDVILVHVPAASTVPGGYYQVADSEEEHYRGDVPRIRTVNLPLAEHVAPPPEVVGVSVP